MNRTQTVKRQVQRCLFSRRAWYGLAAAFAVGILAFVVAWWLLPPLDPAPYLDITASGQLRDRHGDRLFVSLSNAETWSLPQGADAFSDYLIQATVAVEDQRFYRHRGVDPLAVVRAFGQNVREGGVASGASTLTMQLIKLGGYDSRSIAGKADQALRALRLEKALDKDAILRAYLNRAPYGMNLVGAEAAAWRYFGKPAKTLTLSEAALLAGLPKAPGRLDPLDHPEAARVRRDYVLHRMADEGFIDTAARDRALAAPIRAAWHDFPRQAPHLAVPFAEPLAAGESVTLTIDGRLQARLESQVPHYLKRFDGAITNGAILVADVQTGHVLARVGSASFFHTPGGGQVDACLAPRSSGSTLKPFLFGLAMERQQVYPTEVLLDDVLDYGRYAPGNFDGRFNGPVTATEALRYSLNVPAVALLDRVGVDVFHERLRDAGLTTIDQEPAHYGLGLALGNCEVSLEALARLYLSVASLGKRNALQLLAGEAPASRPALFEPPVARALYDMLSQPFPDDINPNLRRRVGNDPPVCWKTGTSTGYHDAWTFAFNQHYLVAVWLGNNDGHGVRQLVGAHAALPLAAQIFRDLPPRDGPAWPAPLSTAPIAICSDAGLPRTDACPRTTEVRLPQGLWQHRRCRLHLPSRAGEAVVARRPAAAATWDLAALPESSASADGKGLQAALSITSPAPGAEFVLSGVPDGDQLPLRIAGDDSEGVHWFMDGRYLGAANAGSLSWPLTPGDHTVVAQHADGRRDTASFRVLRPGLVTAE